MDYYLFTKNTSRKKPNMSYLRKNTCWSTWESSMMEKYLVELKTKSGSLLNSLQYQRCQIIGLSSNG